MRSFAIFCSLFALLACGKAGQTSDNSADSGDNLPDRPDIVAHRGHKAFAPENTTAAFSASVSGGFEWFELDFGAAQDGDLIVMHDSTLNRTTNIEVHVGNRAQRVSNTPIDLIKQLDAGTWFDPYFAGEPVPILADTIEQFSGEIGVILDYKSGTPEQLLSALPGQMADERVIVQSRSKSFAIAFKELLPDQKVTYLSSGRISRATLMDLCEANIDGIAWSHGSLTEANVRLAQGLGLEVWAYTIKRVRDAIRMKEIGVDGIITDIPHEITDI